MFTGWSSIYYKLLLLRNSSWLLPVHLYQRLWNCSYIINVLYMALFKLCCLNLIFFNFFLCQMENLTWPLISGIKLELSFCFKVWKNNVFKKQKSVLTSNIPHTVYVFIIFVCADYTCTIMKISDFKHLSTPSYISEQCTHIIHDQHFK